VTAAPSAVRSQVTTDPALARRLAVASALAVLAAMACYLVMVRTSLGQRIDNAAFIGARAQSGTAAQTTDTDLLRRITADSLAFVLLVLVALGAVRRRLILGLGGAFAAGVAVVGTHLLKNEILTRPDLVAAGAPLGGNTFPSGHTATAVACAMALVLVAPRRGRGPAALVAGAYGWVTAAQVQTAGWHRPSDAIGAAFLAFASVTAVAAILAARRPVQRRTGRQPWLALSLLALVGAVDGLVCLRTLVGVLRYLHAHAIGLPVSGGISHDAYITGLTVTIAVVVVLLMILVALLGRADFGGSGSGTGAGAGTGTGSGTGTGAGTGPSSSSSAPSVL
jgi:membrane-associated phospholipid phosphatase